jgi:CRP-like cAMP-binding protein
LLKSLPIFQGLAQEEVDVLANTLAANTYSKGAKIFETGDKSEALYLVERGFIRLQMANNHALATLGPGSLLGEESLFRGATQEVNAVAATDLTMMELLDRKLREVFLQNPDIGIKISRNFGTLLVQMDDYLVERLTQVTALSGLPRHTLQAIARQLQPRIVRAQTPIHRGGEMPSALFVVEHGAFELRPEPYVPGQETQQEREGAIIGAMALLTNKPYSETAVAVEDSLLWVLPADKFQEINSTNPGLRRSLGRSVRAKLGKADQAQVVLRLSQMPLFAEVPPQSLQAIAQRMVLQHFPAGERVYRIGEAGDAIYFIENGEVELTEENSSGVVVEKARAGAGGFFGEMSLLTGVIRTEDATATRNTNLWILYKADLDDLSAQHPAIGKALSQGLATRLAEPETVQDDLDRFREFAILADLSPADLRQVTRYLRPMRYRAGEAIYQIDGPADALYFLERGQAYAQGYDGNSWVLGAGDTFGERAMLSGEPHSSTVVADSDVDVWMLEKDDFDIVVTRYPSIALNITRMFSRRLNQYAMVPAAPPPSARGGYEPVGGMQQMVPRSPQQRRPAGPPAGMNAADGRSGFIDWFAGLSTFGKVRLAIFILLLLWLLGVAAPWMLLNLFSGTSVASGAALAPGASAQALGAVASMGSFELAARDQDMAKALIVADSLAAPTPTHTPSPTATPEGSGLIFAKAAGADVALAAAPTQTPVPLSQLVGAPPPAAPADTIAAAAQELAAPPPPPVEQVIAAQAPRAWDPRLNQLGITLNDAPVASGQQYWRLVDARWADEAESGGKHHIYVEVLDENGNRIVGQPVTVTWAEGATSGATEDKTPPDYAFNFQMYAAGYAYRVQVDGLPSDQLVGAGLGSIEQRTYGIHTSYYLTYQKTTKP